MSMQELYILVEGEPDSPELPFLQTTINAILQKNNKPYIAKVFEVGGCGAFSNGNLAKTFYKLSEAHKTIPVLAIADNDYRLSHDKKQIDNSQLIKKKKAKILYWNRHEWESYLLEETQLIADFVNQFPDKAVGKIKYRKTYGVTIRKEELDDFLLEYFIKNIKHEFLESLKFNLGACAKLEDYRSIAEPSTFEQDNIETIKNWFSNYYNNKSASISFIRKDIYEEIINEYSWDNLVNNPNKLLFDFAKNKFRGKEALSSLVDFITKKGCTIPKEQFQIDLLKQMNNDSAIIKDLELLILKELL